MSSETDAERLERLRRREERRRKREAERSARNAELQVEADPEDDPASFYLNSGRSSEEPTENGHVVENGLTTSFGDDDGPKENGSLGKGSLEERRPSAGRAQLAVSVKPGEETDVQSEFAEMHERLRQEEERKERQLMEEREAKRQRENKEWEEMKERRERRMREREVEEKARQEREKEMQKKAEEEARLRKEKEDQRKAELQEKRKNQENILTQNKGIMKLAGHLSLKENIRRAKEDAGKSNKELETQKEAALAERVPPLKSNGSRQDMKMYAHELYERLEQALDNVYDLRQRKERQDYDLNELEKRLGVMKNTANTPKILSQVGRVSRLKDIMSEDQNANTVTPKSRSQRDREEGSIGKGGVHGRLAMFEQGGNNSPSQRGKPPPQIKLY